MSAISFLAGLGTGYMDQQDKNRDQKRQDAKDKREADLFDANMADHKQRQADREALQVQAAPVGVTPDQGAPTESTMAAQDPLAPTQPAIGYTAGKGPTAQSFASQGIAQASADKQNANPQGQAQRIAQLAMQGNVQAQTALSSSAATRIHTAQATEAEQKLADRSVKNEIDGLKTPESMAEFMSSSPADKMGGAFKAQAQYSPDKSTFTFNRQNPDGTVTPTGKVFPNTPEGFEQAKMTMAGFMTPEQRLAHSQWKSTFDQKEKEIDRKAKSDDNKDDLANKKEGSEAALRATQGVLNLANAGKADAYERGGGKSAVDRMSEIDKTTLVNINKQRDTIHTAIVKAQADGSYEPNSPGAKAMATQMATLNLKERQIHAQYSDAKAPDPLGARKPAAAPSNTAGYATVTPAQQSANDSDRGAIMASELQAAQARLAQGDPRAQGDIDALNKEMGRLPKSAAQMATSGISAPAPVSQVTAAPAAQQAVQGVQAPAPKPMSTLDKIQADNIAAIAPLAQQFKQAEQMYVAAAKSGDQASVAKYMQAKEQLRAQLEQQLAAKFGNSAPAMLAQVLR